MRDSLTTTSAIRPTTVKHFYKPSFPDGLTDDVPAGGQTLRPLDSYAMVEDRGGCDPQVYTQSPARTSTVVILLIVSFLLTSYCYRKGANYFSRLFKGLWSVKRTENHLDEHTANELLLQISLISITIIMEGIVIYSAMRAYFPALFSSDISVELLLSIGLAGGFYLLQLFSVWLTGYIFAEKDSLRLWMQGYNASQVIMGLVLAPVALTLLFVPEHVNTMVVLAISLYIISRTAYLAKGFRIFYRNIFQCFYFILYLCALEFTPLILLYRIILCIYE